MAEPRLVCIVDDDLSVRRGLSRLVSSFGYRAQSFASAAEYLSAYEGLEVGCLVLDVHLGHMTGIELLEDLRARGVSTPVVIITAHDEPGAESRARQSGIVSYLRKPFDDAAINEAIGHAVARTST
jgi:two-component system response regulator FixJ